MKKISLSFLLFCSLILVAQPATTLANELTVDSSITEPYADRIEWRYQMINGVLHKRQYNYTKEKWLGSWVPV